MLQVQLVHSLLRAPVAVYLQGISRKWIGRLGERSRLNFMFTAHFNSELGPMPCLRKVDTLPTEARQIAEGELSNARKTDLSSRGTRSPCPVSALSSYMVDLVAKPPQACVTNATLHCGDPTWPHSTFTQGQTVLLTKPEPASHLQVVTNSF